MSPFQIKLAFCIVSGSLALLIIALGMFAWCGITMFRSLCEQFDEHLRDDHNYRVG